MRSLILSDIHSNLEAFQAVITHARAHGGFTEIWSLGDLVGYGPDPEPCIDLLRQYPHQAVIGNHDLAVIGKIPLDAFNPYAAAANRWNAARITQDQADYLANLLLTLELDEFTLVHGSPRDPVWEYVVTPQAAIATFTHLDTYWCALGHSHMPFICRPTPDGAAAFYQLPQDTPLALTSAPLIINPGSVGQPRDGDPRASYIIYDAHAATITHHRAAYDIATTQRKMTRHNLPQYLIDRLALGR